MTQTAQQVVTVTDEEVVLSGYDIDVEADTPKEESKGERNLVGLLCGALNVSPWSHLTGRVQYRRGRLCSLGQSVPR
jgi:hypothetical protein